MTKMMAGYIHDMQRKHNALTCYYDFRGELPRAIGGNSIFEKIWVVSSLSKHSMLDNISFVANYTDIIVIDDFTYIEDDLRYFLDRLRKLARDKDSCIFLLNQRRFVRNHATGEFVDRPYRYGLIEKYCAMSIDADIGENRLLNFELPEYDSFARYLLDESCG